MQVSSKKYVSGAFYSRRSRQVKFLWQSSSFWNSQIKGANHAPRSSVHNSEFLVIPKIVCVWPQNFCQFPKKYCPNCQNFLPELWKILPWKDPTFMLFIVPSDLYQLSHPLCFTGNKHASGTGYLCTMRIVEFI